jgi:hypothetical protein
VSAPELERQVLPAEMPLTESVAKLVSTTHLIGHAEQMLRHAGHQTILTKNRIDVDNLVSAQYVGGDQVPRWVVYSLDGTAPQWVIGVMAS